MEQMSLGLEWNTEGVIDGNSGATKEIKTDTCEIR